MPAIAKPQTSRQAKASYKARGRPLLTEQEQRQLQRALELEARAEKARESEKRRAEAARRRTEHEKQARKQPVTALGSQRRVDKFGFLASQFHLGAFFARPKQQGTGPNKEPETGDEDFEDEELDDEDLLRALGDGSTGNAQAIGPSVQTSTSAAHLMPPPPPPARPRTATHTPGGSIAKLPALASTENGLDDFWDQLDSGTQIARDLSSGDHEAVHSQSARSTSFNSADFDDDLSIEDLKQLDPPGPAPISSFEKHQNSGSVTMKGAARNESKASNASADVQPAVSRPPPQFKPAKGRQEALAQGPISAKNTTTAIGAMQRPSNSSVVKSNQQSNLIKGAFMPASRHYCSPDLGFTLTQLETFVDDDIQLTQATPG